MPDLDTTANELVTAAGNDPVPLAPLEFAYARGFDPSDYSNMDAKDVPKVDAPNYWGESYAKLGLSRINDMQRNTILAVSRSPYGRELDPYWQETAHVAEMAESSRRVDAMDTRFKPNWADSYGYTAHQLWRQYGIALGSGVAYFQSQEHRGWWYDLVDKYRQAESVYAASNVGTFQSITAGLAGSLADPMLLGGMAAGAAVRKAGMANITMLQGLAGAQLEKAVAINIANAMRAGAGVQALGAAARVSAEGGMEGDSPLLTAVAATSAAALTGWLGMWGGGEQAFGGVSSLKKEAWQIVAGGIQGGGEEAARQLAVQQFDPTQIVEQAALELLGETVFSAPHLGVALMEYRNNVADPLKVTQQTVTERVRADGVVNQLSAIPSLGKAPNVAADYLEKAGFKGEVKVSKAAWDDFWKANGARGDSVADKWGGTQDLLGNYHIPVTKYFGHLNTVANRDQLMDLVDHGSGQTAVQVREMVARINAKQAEYLEKIRQVDVQYGKERRAIVDTVVDRMIQGGANKQGARNTAEIYAEFLITMAERAQKSGLNFTAMDIFNAKGMNVAGAEHVAGPSGDETTARKALADVYKGETVAMYTAPGWVDEKGAPIYTTMKERAEAKAAGAAVTEHAIPADTAKLHGYRRESPGIVFETTLDKGKLSQAAPGESRGTYDRNTRKIKFNKGADVSTPLHETAHHMFDVWAQIAAMAPANTPLGLMATDFQKWISKNASDVRAKYIQSLAEPADKLAAETELSDLTVLANADPKFMAEGTGHAWAAAHEYFATGFEQYVATQKAPSKSIAAIFRSFASLLNGLWRRMIGRNLVTPEVNLDDNAKTFMSAMLATDAAMKEIELDTKYAELAEKAASYAGVDQRDAGNLVKIVAKERSVIEESLLKATLASMEQARSKERADYKASKERDVIAEAEANDPKNWAIANLLSDMLANERKISQADAAGAREKGLTEALQRQGVVTKKGVTGTEDVDALALNYGYPSAKEFMVALAKAETREKYLGVKLEALADEKFPGIQTDADLIQEARERVLADNHLSLLAAEAVLIQRADALKLDDYKRAMAGLSDSQSAEESARWMKEQEANMHIVRAVEADNVSKVPPALMHPEHWEKLASSERQAMLDAMEKGDFKAAESHHFTVRSAEIRANLERKAKQQGRELIADISKYSEGKKLRRELETGGTWQLNVIGEQPQAFSTEAEAENALALAQKRTVAGSLPPVLTRRSLTLDFVDSLLEKYSFVKGRRALAIALDLREQARKAKAALAEIGREPDAPESVISDAEAMHVSEIPLGALHLLKKSLDSARANHKLMNDASSASNTQQIAADVDSIAKIADKLSGYEQKNTILKGVTDVLRFATSHNTRLSTLVHMLDGGDNGVLNKRVLEPLRKAHSAIQIMVSDRVDAFQRIVSAKPKTDRTKDKDILTAGAFTTTREEARTLVAHWGSLDGRRYVAAHMMAKAKGMTVDQAMDLFPTVIDQMTETDINVVRWIWQSFEGTRMRTAEAKRKLGEGEPEWIESAPFVAGDQILSGGYAPVVYVEGSYASLAEMDAIEADNQTAKPNESHHKRRAGPQQGKWMDLSHDMLVRNLGFHATTAFMLEPAVHIKALMSQALPMIAEKWGLPVSKSLQSHLIYAVVGDRTKNDFIVKAAGWAYQRASLGALLFNAWTAAQQPSGLSNATNRVGVRHMSNAIKSYAQRRQRTVMFAETASQIMKARMGRFDHAMQDAMVSSRAGSLSDKFIKVGMSHIAWMQRQVDIIAWTAAYQKAIETQPHLDAVSYADQVVLETQGSAMGSELAPIQQNRAMRLLAIFATYPMTVFNEIRLAGISNGDTSVKRAARVGWALLYNLTIPSVLTYMLAQVARGGNDDEKEWDTALWEATIQSHLSGVLSMSPAVRAFEKVLTQGANNIDIPAARPVIAALQSGRDAIDPDEEVTFSNFVRAMALVVPFPSVAINRIHDALNEHEVDDIEFYKSAIFGDNPPAK
jgi:hypothetical protein